MPTPDASSDTGDVFAWDTTLLTGLDEVDAQHHHLVNLFNRLNRAMFHGRALSPDQQQRIFDELIAYARQHFEDEERQMARIRAGADPAEAWAQEEDPLDRRVANLLRMVALPDDPDGPDDRG
ncbi:bacteriohemerythrin [Tepidimonas sp.]|uniref:bacteriohemerythrin n=1 Tax=Tepidimonas sp. TaxID=2002775 RepID=UPI00391DC738